MNEKTQIQSPEISPLSMRELQSQMIKRQTTEGEEIPEPRLAQPRPSQVPSAQNATKQVAKSFLKKYATLILPLGSAGAGGLLGYWLS